MFSRSRLLALSVVIAAGVVATPALAKKDDHALRNVSPKPTPKVTPKAAPSISPGRPAWGIKWTARGGRSAVWVR